MRILPVKSRLVCVLRYRANCILAEELTKSEMASATTSARKGAQFLFDRRTGLSLSWVGRERIDDLNRGATCVGKGNSGSNSERRAAQNITRSLRCGEP
jgi:hypothetical protein